MAHFAKVCDGLVKRVIVVEPEFFDTFIDDSPGVWLQTSYNTHGGVHYGQDGQPDAGIALRFNFAGVGYTYDATRDAFIPPQPGEDWALNGVTCLWQPPADAPVEAD